jgi:DNA recombination protein RmuC
MFTPIVAIIFVLFMAALLWLVFDLKKNMHGGDEREKMAVILDRLKMLSQQNQELRQEIDSKLSETHIASREQMKIVSEQSNRQIANVVAGLTKLEETNKQVVNFSAQLQNLQDILKNPKQRGILGEYFLEETLKNVLPPNSYQMQYAFKNGVIVDAVVFVKDKVIPIDSKFSLENYERALNSSDAETRDKYSKQFKNDLKTRIDETAKYVKPSEGTMDFAFMFIPSESIYYDLLTETVGIVNSRDLIDYAFKEKHVIIVSPTSFLAYLQTVLQGLRALNIEESAKEIRANVEKLGNHIISYEEYFKKLGNSLGTTVSHYNTAYKELGKIDKDVSRIAETEKTIEPLTLEKPHEIL